MGASNSIPLEAHHSPWNSSYCNILPLFAQHIGQLTVDVTPIVVIVEPATGMQAVAGTKTGSWVIELDVALLDLGRTFAS